MIRSKIASTPKAQKGAYRVPMVMPEPVDLIIANMRRMATMAITNADTARISTLEGFRFTRLPWEQVLDKAESTSLTSITLLIAFLNQYFIWT
jgi:hypothetical protein